MKKSKSQSTPAAMGREKFEVLDSRESKVDARGRGTGVGGIGHAPNGVGS